MYTRDILWAIGGLYPAAVFMIVPINNVMTAVFVTPVATIGIKHPLRVSLFRGSVGIATGDVTGEFVGCF